MSALDPFAFGAQDDAELIALEQELLATTAKLGAPDISEDQGAVLSREWRELERRINYTKPKTTIGVAIKLRQSLRVAEGGPDMEDDDIACLQQAIAFMESGAVAVEGQAHSGLRADTLGDMQVSNEILIADPVPQSARCGTSWPIAAAPIRVGEYFGPVLLFPCKSGVEPEWCVGVWTGESWAELDSGAPGWILEPQAWAPLPPGGKWTPPRECGA